jgi:dethiobiotin synthetase
MIEGRSLDDQALLAWVRDLSGPHVLVEGVGGWCVPVTEELWVRDLAAATAAPVLVVAADRLGVLNHTLLTVRAVRDDGFEVVGVVLNQGVNVAPDDVSTQSNADDLRQLLDVPVVVLGRVSADNEADAGRALLEALPVIRSTANSGEA